MSCCKQSSLADVFDVVELCSELLVLVAQALDGLVQLVEQRVQVRLQDRFHLAVKECFLDVF